MKLCSCVILDSTIIIVDLYNMNLCTCVNKGIQPMLLLEDCMYCGGGGGTEYYVRGMIMMYMMYILISMSHTPNHNPTYRVNNQ